MIDLLFIKWKYSGSGDSPVIRIRSFKHQDVVNEEYPILAVPISDNPETNEALSRCIGEKICQFDCAEFSENEAYTYHGYFQLDHEEFEEMFNISQLLGQVAVYDVTESLNKYRMENSGNFDFTRIVAELKEGKVVP